jgi:hypothetical protein
VVRAGSVRDALRAIASVRPDPALLRLELCRLRALLDQERRQLRERLAEGVPVAEVARAEARLLDGTILGLCHLGRLLEPAPADMAPPLAVIARGDYGRRKLAPGTSAGLLFLVAGDPVPREHGLAVAQFVAGVRRQAHGARLSDRDASGPGDRVGPLCRAPDMGLSRPVRRSARRSGAGDVPRAIPNDLGHAGP